MFVYLFVWETLSIPEETRDTRGRPAGAPETPQQTRDTRDTPAGDQRKARCNYPINYLKFY